jgi:hypothetical protein
VSAAAVSTSTLPMTMVCQWVDAQVQAVQINAMSTTPQRAEHRFRRRTAGAADDAVI